MSSTFHHKKLANTQDEAARVRPMKKIISRSTSTAALSIFTIFLCIVASAIALVLILFCVTRSGFDLVIEAARRDSTYNNYLSFPIGGVIMLMGLMFLIIGFAIVADFALGNCRLTSRYRRMENEAAREVMSTGKVIGRIVGAVISLFSLLWIIYAGFKFTIEPRRDSKYNQLAFSVGIVTMAFGVVYFIMGLAIIKDLAGRLQWKEKGNWLSISS